MNDVIDDVTSSECNCEAFSQCAFAREFFIHSFIHRWLISNVMIANMTRSYLMWVLSWMDARLTTLISSYSRRALRLKLCWFDWVLVVHHCSRITVMIFASSFHLFCLRIRIDCRSLMKWCAVIGTPNSLANIATRWIPWLSMLFIAFSPISDRLWILSRRWTGWVFEWSELMDSICLRFDFVTCISCIDEWLDFFPTAFFFFKCKMKLYAFSQHFSSNRGYAVPERAQVLDAGPAGIRVFPAVRRRPARRWRWHRMDPLGNAVSWVDTEHLSFLPLRCKNNNDEIGRVTGNLIVKQYIDLQGTSCTQIQSCKL